MTCKCQACEVARREIALTPEERLEKALAENPEAFKRYLGAPRAPDLVIAPRGVPYLYRWHAFERNADANVYFHVQVGDDPERPLHDHQYASQSVILAGGYEETYQTRPPRGPLHKRVLRKGDTAHRSEIEAHRLKLLGDYSISLFSTGPRVREWGFWIDNVWHPWSEVTEGDYRVGGVSQWRDVTKHELGSREP